jgi:polysaccharide deacetylase family protein (PEP-CTERM system associated)
VRTSSRVLGLVEQQRRSLAPEQSKIANTGPGSGIVNAMTVDVEDYFHVRAFSKILDPNEWGSMPSRVEANTDRVLDLFARKNVLATFFILGWVAERHPSLVRRIVSAGHEIASHGYGHQGIDCQTTEQFRGDVRHAKAVLEDISQQRVRGYRAPTFSVSAKTWWAYEILAEEGYAYSSSLYPIAHDLYGMPDAPRTPFRPTAGLLLEIPLTTVRVFNRNYPASGGGFFRLLPYTISRCLIAHVNRRDGNPCIFYWHPWEIDPGQPRVAGSSLRSRLRHYTNLGAMARRIGFLLDDFSWGRMDNVFLKEPSLRIVK